MANGTLVKYKKVYKITVEGKSDTAHPEEKPYGLRECEILLEGIVDILNNKYAWRNVTIKEMK